MMDREKIRKKWTPVLGSFDYNNIETINIICIFAEWYSINNYYYYSTNELPNKLKEIKEKIDNYDQLNRIEILGEFINPCSGIIQYKLANGKFINKVEKLVYKLSSSEMLHIFGEDFVKYYSTEDYRDVRLNELGI